MAGRGSVQSARADAVYQRRNKRSACDRSIIYITSDLWRSDTKSRSGMQGIHTRKTITADSKQFCHLELLTQGFI